MELDFAFLCAWASEDDNITARGIGVEYFYSETAPFTADDFYCVAQLVTPDEAQAAIPLATSLRLVDDAGGELGRVEVDLGPMVWSKEDGTGSVRAIIGLYGVRIPAFATYTLHFVVNGDDMKQFRLRAVYRTET